MAGLRKGLGQPATWIEAFRRGAIFLAFAIPFVGLIGLIAGAWSVKGEWGTAADWIQAIGSLIAIAIAIAIPARQRRHEIEDQRAQATQRLIDSTKAMRSLIIGEALVVEEAVGVLCNGTGWELVMVSRTRKHIRALDALANYAAMVDQLDLLSLGPEYVGYVVDLRQRVAVLGRISRVPKMCSKQEGFAQEYSLYSQDLRQLQTSLETLHELEGKLNARLEHLEQER